MATSDNNQPTELHCFERGLTPVQTKREKETIELHKHLSQTLVYTWQKRFKDSRSGEPVEELCDRPTKREDKYRVRDVVCEDCLLTVHEVGDMLLIGKSCVQRILSDLSMTRVCALWVPRLLNEGQM